jgi:uncharacterized protein (TIGR03067 family)
MRITLVLFLLSAGLLLAAGGGKDDGKRDLARIQGTWRRVSAEVDGMKVPEAELRRTTLNINGNKYTLEIGQMTRKGTLKLDPTKTPPQIDILSAAGPNKGKTIPGIYKLAGDTFTYCLAQPGKARPTAFSGKAGSGQGLYVNQRQKK